MNTNERWISEDEIKTKINDWLQGWKKNLKLIKVIRWIPNHYGEKKANYIFLSYTKVGSERFDRECLCQSETAF